MRELKAKEGKGREDKGKEKGTEENRIFSRKLLEKLSTNFYVYVFLSFLGN